METLRMMIEEQRKGKECTPLWGIGSQLMDMAAESTVARDLIKRDLAVPEMNLEAAAKHFATYADKNRGGKNQFCITPDVADGLLRKFYGLPDKPQGGALPAADEGYIDLGDLLSGEV